MNYRALLLSSFLFAFTATASPAQEPRFDLGGQKCAIVFDLCLRQDNVVEGDSGWASVPKAQPGTAALQSQLHWPRQQRRSKQR
jgi:hypothetical protein